MKTSEAIDQIAKALAEFQKVMKGAEKDASNPFFKSKYATLESTITAIKPAHSLGLSFIQGGGYTEEMGWHICTRILHISGQWIQTFHPVVVAKQNDPQAFGSAEAYAKRYALKSMFGIPDQDDDAESAVQRSTPYPAKTQAPQRQLAPMPAKPLVKNPTPQSKVDKALEDSFFGS